jgi:hypothetical protein
MLMAIKDLLSLHQYATPKTDPQGEAFSREFLVHERAPIKISNIFGWHYCSIHNTIL